MAGHQRKVKKQKLKEIKKSSAVKEVKTIMQYVKMGNLS